MMEITARDLTHLVEQLSNSKTYVDVYNCKATFFIAGKHENEFQLSDKQKEALEKLKEYVVYTVNEGAINWSGIYRLNDTAYEALRLILTGNTEDALAMITPPAEEDFQKKAELLISIMGEGDWNTVSSSGLACGDFCNGYHHEQYIAILNGKLVLVDNGKAHHALSFEKPRIVKELTTEEAIKLLSDYLKELTAIHDWTKAELEDYELESSYMGMKIDDLFEDAVCNK